MRKLLTILFCISLVAGALAQGYRVVVVPDGTDPNDLFSSKSALTNAALVESTANAVLLSNGMLYVTMNTNLSLEAVLATGNDGGGEQIKNIGDPTDDQDAITKAFGDANYVTEGTLPTITNFDYSVNYNGYPKLTLTTNMVSSSVSGDTPISISAFTNAFDGNFDTEAGIGTWNADAHAYMIDLGAVYSGYVVVCGVLSNANASGVTYWGLATGGEETTIASGGIDKNFWNGERINAANGTMAFCRLNENGESTNLHIRSFIGSKIVLQGEANGYVASYRFKEIAIYGVTNGFNNFVGTVPR